MATMNMTPKRKNWAMRTMKIKTPKNQEIVQTTYMNGFDNNPTHVITYNKITGMYIFYRVNSDASLDKLDSGRTPVFDYR